MATVTHLRLSRHMWHYIKRTDHSLLVSMLILVSISPSLMGPTHAYTGHQILACYVESARPHPQLLRYKCFVPTHRTKGALSRQGEMYKGFMNLQYKAVSFR